MNHSVWTISLLALALTACDQPVEQGQGSAPMPPGEVEQPGTSIPKPEAPPAGGTAGQSSIGVGSEQVPPSTEDPPSLSGEETLQRKLQELSEVTRQQAGTLSEQAKEAAGAIGEKAKEVGAVVGEQSEQLWEETKQRSHELGRQAIDQGREVLDEAGRKLESPTEERAPPPAPQGGQPPGQAIEI